MSLFMLRGRGYAWWLPSVAAASGMPTLAEIAAGIPLGKAMSSLQGFEPQTNKINVPIMAYKAEAQIGGPETYQNVVLTIAEDDGTGVDADALERQNALTTMTANVSGVLVLSRTLQALVAGSKVHTIAATIDSQIPNWNLDAAAATTAINLSPSTPLRKGVVLA